MPLTSGHFQHMVYTQPLDDTGKLPVKGQRCAQKIVGKFFFYGRPIDSTILPALNDISTSQAAPTLNTAKKTNILMDFLYTSPNANLRFYAGNMQLHIKSDAVYLVLTGARSRAAGHLYLSATPSPGKVYQGRFNTPLHTKCRTIKNVVSSVAKAECAALFHNCSIAVGICSTLEGLGHPQHCTEVITDFSAANSFVHSEMQVKQSKSWDMRYNWLRDRIAQAQFNIKWKEGIHNLADYFTKHHQIKRSDYILRGF